MTRRAANDFTAQAANQHGTELTVDRGAHQNSRLHAEGADLEHVFAAHQLVLMPVHGNERRCSRDRGTDVFLADNAHHAAPIPDHAHQCQRDRPGELVQPQSPGSQAPARGRLLSVDGVAKPTLFRFVWHEVLSACDPWRATCKLQWAMQTTAVPPGPSEGFDLGGSEESL